MTGLNSRRAAWSARWRSRPARDNAEPYDASLDRRHFWGSVATWAPVACVVLALAYFLFRLYGYVAGGGV